MSPHESRLIHIASYAVDVPFAGVLPHGDVALIGQQRLLLSVLGNHEGVVVDFPHQVLVIKVGEGIEERFLMIGIFYEQEKLHQRVTKLLALHPLHGLDINHRYEVLLAGQTLGEEVSYLFLLFSAWSVKVVTAHFDALLMCHLDIALIGAVDMVAALGGF